MVIHIVAFSIALDNKIPLLRRSQIAYPKADKAPNKVSSKYTDFVNIFLWKLATKFFKHTRIKNYTIEFINNWQPLYGLIYSTDPVELEILKTYIENNLANSFIRPSKSSARVSIFFDKKPNRSLKLCVH